MKCIQLEKYSKLFDFKVLFHWEDLSLMVNTPRGVDARSLKIRAITEIRCLRFSLMLQLRYRSMKIYKPFVIPSLVLKVSSTYVILTT